MGGCKICAWDFRPQANEPVPVREKWAQRRQTGRRLWNKLRNRREPEKTSGMSFSDMPLAELSIQDTPFPKSDMEKTAPTDIKPGAYSGPNVTPGYTSASNTLAPPITRYRSHQEVISTVQSLHDTIQLAPVSSRSSRNRVIIPGREYDVPEDAVPRIGCTEEQNSRDRSIPPRESPKPEKGVAFKAPVVERASPDTKPTRDAPAPWYRMPANILKLILTPPSISLFLALPISLVQPLKALFVHVDGWTGGRIPNSPDGKPPLSWLLDVSANRCVH
jgi:hypothetical protein